jgi:gluconokinase
MGVSGTGKSTIGKMLAERLEIPFFDGDDFHPKANVEKMAAGLPLNDDDRLDWLKSLNRLGREHKDSGTVIACSALKESYRKILKTALEEHLVFIHLEGSFELITSRMEARKGHFMPLKLLRSQFDTLEPPKEAINISITDSPKEIVDSILNQLSR